MPFLSRFSRSSSRKNNGNQDPADDADDFSPRAFNNPNLQFSVRFKNKVKNNNFEFIVTVEPEDPSEDLEKSSEGGNAALSESLDSIPEKNTAVIKQYKVKRNLYEF